MTPRIGLLARSEQKGLGLQTFEVCRHVNPARVLLIEPQPRRWATNPHWYDPWPTTVAQWWCPSGRDYVLDERLVRTWLDGLDVIYTAESLYDWRLSDWAAQAGCAVVCHINPELLPPVAHQTPGVTWWAPTPWLLDRLPEGTKVVPLPVATETIPAAPARGGEEPVRFVHVAGHAAMLDRNGTRLLANTVRHLRCPCQIAVTGQDGRLPQFVVRDRRVKVVQYPRGLPNYWDAYQGDVLVMPRRYGGLSMPVQEAMAAGMAVLMPGISPNDVWPGPRFRATYRQDVNMLGGRIPIFEPDQTALRAMMTDLAHNRTEVASHQADARSWAAAHSWDALLPLWLAEFDAARTNHRTRL